MSVAAGTNVCGCVAVLVAVGANDSGCVLVAAGTGVCGCVAVLVSVGTVHACSYQWVLMPVDACWYQCVLMPVDACW